MEDFSEFQCNGPKCLGNKSIKDMVEILNGQKRLNDKLMKQGAEIIKKTKCHPYI